VPALAAEGIEVRFGPRLVLRDVSLSVRSGSLVGLVGPNGAGKSTLVRVLAGALRPERGVVMVDGRDLRRLGRRDLARRLAVVPQDSVLPEGFTALDIVLMGRSPHLGLLASESEADRRIAREAMLTTDTWSLAERPVEALSGGERQRVVVARAIAQQPAILLLDEPTSHLDLHHQVRALEIVRGLCAGGMAALGVFHDLNLAAQYCDRIGLLHAGSLVAEGSPEQVITSANVQQVYGEDLVVRPHPTNGRPVVLVSRREMPAGKHPNAAAWA
jgi:iron complex transport system ATP-binding protein